MAAAAERQAQLAYNAAIEKIPEKEVKALDNKEAKPRLKRNPIRSTDDQGPFGFNRYAIILVRSATCIILSYHGLEKTILLGGMKMKPEDLPAEQKEVKLTDEQFESASGGTDGYTPTFTCPQCGSTNVWYYYEGDRFDCRCQDCGFEWQAII